MAPHTTTSAAPPEVLQLFPLPVRKRALSGLYLEESLPAPESEGVAPFLYANFVTSLDGRIAVAGGDGVSRLPEGLTNPRDWRLFQELQAHADCLVTHGGYLRALAAEPSATSSRWASLPSARTSERGGGNGACAPSPR